MKPEVISHHLKSAVLLAAVACCMIPWTASAQVPITPQVPPTPQVPVILPPPLIEGFKTPTLGQLQFLGKTVNGKYSVWLSTTNAAGSFQLQTQGNQVVDAWMLPGPNQHNSQSPFVSNGSGGTHFLMEVSGPKPVQIDSQNQKGGGIVLPPGFELPPKLPPFGRPPGGGGFWGRRPKPPAGLMPTKPGGVKPPLGKLPPTGGTPSRPGRVPPPTGLMPTRPGGVQPPIGTLPPGGLLPARPGHVPPPTGVMPTKPGGVQLPIGALPPSGLMPTRPGRVPPPTGVMPTKPGGVQPPIGTLPPTGVMPTRPGRVPPSTGVMPEHPIVVQPPVGKLPPGGGVAPGHPGGFVPPTSTLPPYGSGAGTLELPVGLEGIDPATLEAMTYEQSLRNYWNVWTDGRYYDSNDERQGLNREGTGYSVTIGADHRLTERFTLGVMGVFEEFNSSALRDFVKSGSRGYTVGPYLAYQLSSAWMLEGSFGYGRAENESELFSLFGEFTTERYTGSLSLSGNYVLGPINLRPRATVAYTHFKSEAYELRGNIGPFPIALPRGADTFDCGSTEITLEFNHAFQTRHGMIMVPYVELGFTYEFERPNDGEILTSTFTTASTSPCHGSVRLGARVLVTQAVVIEASAGYLSVGQRDLDLWEGRLFLSYAF